MRTLQVEAKVVEHSRKDRNEQIDADWLMNLITKAHLLGLCHKIR